MTRACFVPDALARKALIEALKRSMKIRITTPGEISVTATVRAASRGIRGSLVQACAGMTSERAVSLQ
ncbi:MAG: hypothetical protein Q8O29_19355 [Polaromonas sp.]|uniref:hypothetical protein n=1 Tax=Polaromonas sp. TaxID=1869339 RepID=UPI00273255A5|nr:hypothetical protein [Polaromonas sp.]MDP2820391.1 hypothetical protein [Polaromonas sp.]